MSGRGDGLAGNSHREGGISVMGHGPAGRGQASDQASQVRTKTVSAPRTTSPSQSTPSAAKSRVSQSRAPTPILAAIRTEPLCLTLTDHAVTAPACAGTRSPVSSYTNAMDSTGVVVHQRYGL